MTGKGMLSAILEEYQERLMLSTDRPEGRRLEKQVHRAYHLRERLQACRPGQDWKRIAR